MIHPMTWSNRSLSVAILCSTFAGLGCATNSGANWNKRGYSQGLFGYEVAYHDVKDRTLIGPDWQLDNFRRYTGGHWEEKKGYDYTATRAQDINQNGTIEFAERRKEPIFDLRFTNRKDNGVIWAKAHPFLPSEADQELEVILDNYVDSLEGDGIYAQGNLFSVERERVRSFTTFVVSKQVTRIGQSDALSATVEIAEVEKLKSNPKHRSGMVQVVMVKMHCLTPANCRSMAPSWPWTTCRGRRYRAPVGLLVVGYYNTPSHFDKGLPELKKLLERISFPNAEPIAVPPIRQESREQP